MTKFDEILNEVKKHLDSARQNWLLGAGVSVESNIPLMRPLTDRIKFLINESDNDSNKKIYSFIESEVFENSHVEHYLSHLCDLIAIAERSKSKCAKLGGEDITIDELKTIHRSIISCISATIRYGYRNDNGESIGDANNPIVTINNHRSFVSSILKSRANLEGRSDIKFFTINYDTLLEDSLALEKRIVIDGFSGGAVGFWNPYLEFNKKERLSDAVSVYKLHGSIDWRLDKEQGLVRARYGTTYLSNPEDTLIYPQATKYVETQRDPFAFLFAEFRSSLITAGDNLLIICGYSFGDEHINLEIEAAMLHKSSDLTLIVFMKLEEPFCTILKKWLEDKRINNRVYLITNKGLFHSSSELIQHAEIAELNWWKFSELPKFILTGEAL